MISDGKSYVDFFPLETKHKSHYFLLPKFVKVSQKPIVLASCSYIKRTWKLWPSYLPSYCCNIIFKRQQLAILHQLQLLLPRTRLMMVLQWRQPALTPAATTKTITTTMEMTVWLRTSRPRQGTWVWRWLPWHRSSSPPDLHFLSCKREEKKRKHRSLSAPSHNCQVRK